MTLGQMDSSERSKDSCLQWEEEDKRKLRDWSEESKENGGRQRGSEWRKVGLVMVCL